MRNRPFCPYYFSRIGIKKSPRHQVMAGEMLDLLRFLEVVVPDGVLASTGLIVAVVLVFVDIDVVAAAAECDVHHIAFGQKPCLLEFRADILFFQHIEFFTFHNDILLELFDDDFLTVVDVHTLLLGQLVQFHTLQVVDAGGSACSSAVSAFDLYDTGGGVIAPVDGEVESLIDTLILLVRDEHISFDDALKQLPLSDEEKNNAILMMAKDCYYKGNISDGDRYLNIVEKRSHKGSEMKKQVNLLRSRKKFLQL